MDSPQPSLEPVLIHDSLGVAAPSNSAVEGSSELQETAAFFPLPTLRPGHMPTTRAATRQITPSGLTKHTGFVASQGWPCCCRLEAAWPFLSGELRQAEETEDIRTS